MLELKTPWECILKMNRLQTLEIELGKDFYTFHSMEQRHIDDFVSKMTSLRKLCIHNASIPLKLDSITTLCKLATLSLYNSNVKSLEFLSPLNSISKLCLSKVRVSNNSVRLCDSFKVVSKLTNLRRLYVWDIMGTNELISNFTTLTNLQTLDVSGNEEITDTGLLQLTRLLSLQILDKSNTCITRHGFSKLKSVIDDNCGQSTLEEGYILYNPLMSRRSRRVKFFTTTL